MSIVKVSFVRDHEEVTVGLTLENVKFHWLSPHTLNFGCGPSRHGTEVEYCQGLNQSLPFDIGTHKFIRITILYTNKIS